MRKCGILKITLHSDLCMSSGYSWAGAIDSDICYDEYGLPYIPARRLKGSMREAASLYRVLSETEAEKLFGRSRAGGVEGITIENARMEGDEELREAFEELKRSGSPLAGYLRREKVLECFTRVLGQTRLTDGTAADKSLRFVRVLSARSPLDEKQLIFRAAVFFEDEDGSVERNLSMAAKATRNIGLRRNRGFGSVSCELVDIAAVQKKPAVHIPDMETGSRKSEREDSAMVISYSLRNADPLLLCADANDLSEDYIGGQSVLGRLAANYLSLPGKSAEDEAFKDLFLRGKAVFTNVMPWIDGRICYPAPLYLKRLKRTRKLVNTLFAFSEGEMEAAYSQEEGNQAQRLKGKFAAIGETARVHEVSKSIVYHYSRTQKTREGQDGLLYSLEAVKENQRFAGKIYLPQKYAGLVMQLLGTMQLRFGKSKGAEYGKCILEEMDCKTAEEKFCKVNKGDDFAVTLLSDAVFLNDNGYTVNYGEVSERIAGELGISREEDAERSMMRTKELFGYHTKWNLRRAPVSAVAAGSVFICRAAADMMVPVRFIGEKNLEGFGQIRVDRLADMAYMVEESAGQSVEKEMSAGAVSVLRPLTGLIIKNRMLDELKAQAVKMPKVNVSPSTLGRAVLMLQESLDENRNDGPGARDAFCRRLCSVKRKEECEKLKKLSGFVEKEKRLKSWTEIIQDTKCQDFLRASGLTDEDCSDIFMSVWGEYLMTVFKDQEYRMKDGKECRKG